MELSDRGLKLICDFEGFRAKAYYCPAGVVTIGYGTTLNVKMGMKVTKAEAERLLRRDLVRFQACVTKSVNVPLTQGQYDALVSLCYNIGEGAFRKSTLLKLLNQKRYDAACRQFDRWTKGGGKVLPGLVRRRAAEAALFKSGDDLDDEEPIAPSTVVEAVEPKSAMNSKTVAGAGVAVAAGGGAVLEQASDVIEKHQTLVEAMFSSQSLPIWLGLIAGVALFYVVVRYLKDREERI